jgi:Concanavalin A-like lectin/glucanases superfamily/Peptidase family M23
MKVLKNFKKMKKVMLIAILLSVKSYGQNIIDFVVPNNTTDKSCIGKMVDTSEIDPCWCANGTTCYSSRHLQYLNSSNSTHFGIDIWSSKNSPIFSFADGVVHDVIKLSTSSNYNSLGYMVIIKHSRASATNGDLYSTYFHQNTAPLVNLGDNVKIGQLIGYVGKTGSANGIIHTHFETRKFTSRFNSSTNCNGGNNIYHCGNASNLAWAINDWEDPESITIPNFGQIIYAGNASNPQNIQIIFKAPEWTLAQTFTASSITNIQINNATTTENVTGGVNISKFSNLGNNWYSFELDLPTGRSWINGQNYDLRFNIATTTRSLRAFGSSIVKFSDGTFSEPNFSKRWESEYAKKASLLGLIGGAGSEFRSETSMDFATAARLVVNAGIKLRILSNNNAGMAGSFDNIVPTNIPKSDLSYYYFQILNNWGYTIPTNITPSTPITTGQFKDMLISTFGIDASTNNTLVSVNNLTPTTNCTSNDNLLKTKYLYRMKVETPIKPYSEAILSCNHSNSTPMTKAILTKILVNTYEYKHQVNFQISPNVNARIASINSTTDFQVLGTKKEFQSNTIGTTLPQSTDETITMNAGQQRTFSFPDVTINGQPVSCYWSIDGGTLQQFGAAPYFQSIKWTAPIVSTQTTFTLYSFSTTAGGYASEKFRTIIVNPANNNISISVDKPNACLNETIQLSANNCSGEILWNNGLGNGLNVSDYASPNRNYVASCLLNGTIISTSNTLIVSIKETPPIVTVSSNPGNIVLGQSSTINASNCTGQIAWLRNGVTNIGSGNSITVSPTVDTYYAAKCTISNGCTNAGSDWVYVNSSPIVPALSISFWNYSSICVGQPLSMGVSPFIGGCENGTVSWHYGADPIPFATGRDITFYPTLRQNNSCFYARCTENGVISDFSNCLAPEVQVFPPKPIVTANKSSIKVGETSTLTAGGCLFSIIEWSNSLGTGGVKNVSPTTTTTYYANCKRGSIDGCRSEKTAITIYVNQIDPPAITTSSSQICSGQSVTLTATNCTGTVTWNNSLGTGTSKTINPTQNTIYTAFCTENSIISGNSNEISIDVSSVTGGTISPATQTLCQDPSVGISRLLSETLVLSGYNGNILKWEYKTPTSGWNDWGQGGLESPSDCCFGWMTGTWKVRALIGNSVCTSVYSTEANIVVIPLSSAVLSGTQTITAGQTASLSVTLTGEAPWSIVMNGTTYTANTSPFSISVSPSLTTTYSLTNVNNSCGAGTVSGSAVITVNTDCPSSVVFPIGAQVSGIYQVNNTLISGASALSSSIIIYTAGNSITLLPGFKVSSGSFSAKIQGCSIIAPTLGLKLHLPFDGNGNDISGNNNNGIVSGASLGIDRFGIPNKSYRFIDGNFITVTNSTSLNLTNAFTFSMWVNMQSTTGRDGYGAINTYGYHSLFTKNCDRGQLQAAIVPNSNGTFQFNTYASSIGSNPSIPFALNQWKHLSVVYDGTNLMHFVNGILVSSLVANLNLTPSNSYNLIIGKMGCWGYFFNGFIDEFRMYNRGLTNSEVNQIYNSEKP